MRSAARDARQTARSYPNCMAPARRTTSPPMVVGKKLLANSPVKVRAMESENDIFTLPERIRMNQRMDTKNRETRIKVRPSMILVNETCLRADTTSFQPPSLTRRKMRPMARTCPSRRSSSRRLSRNHSAIGGLLHDGLAHRVSELLLGLVIGPGQQFSHQAHEHGLESKDQGHDCQKEKR